MVSFIHIADKNDEKSILKNGIKCPKRKSGIRGVYAVPVVPNWSITHQWARELKRRGIKTLICVQFRVPNAESVFVGKYDGEKLNLIASVAFAETLKHEDPMGLEVIIPRKIVAKEIVRIYPAPQIIGWRYYPTAKGKKPFCRCKFCNRGEIRAQRLIQEDA
jgi:hypothetical protein